MVPNLSIRGVSQEADTYRGQPLFIVGPGPSYDLVPPDLYADHHVFALNAAITELTKHRSCWWVSNDHDRTFQSKGIAREIKPRIKCYQPWRTITNRKFIPGPFGDIEWVDHNGRKQLPLKWRLRPPDGSSIWWYVETHDQPGYLRNGESVLELALEVASLWGFSPIILVGVDMCFVKKQVALVRARKSDCCAYYAKRWGWKYTPNRMFRGKFNDMRSSITSNLDRWSTEIFTLSPYLKIFRSIDVEGAQKLAASNPVGKS